jgi:hypothetical protein
MKTIVAFILLVPLAIAVTVVVEFTVAGHQVLNSLGFTSPTAPSDTAELRRRQ